MGSVLNRSKNVTSGELVYWLSDVSDPTGVQHPSGTYDQSDHTDHFVLKAPKITETNTTVLASQVDAAVRNTSRAEGDAEGYTRGKAEGNTEGDALGYNRGVNEGDTAGYTRGHAEGFTAGVASVDITSDNATQYQAGYDAGYAQCTADHMPPAPPQDDTPTVPQGVEPWVVVDSISLVYGEGEGNLPTHLQFTVSFGGDGTDHWSWYMDEGYTSWNQKFGTNTVLIPIVGMSGGYHWLNVAADSVGDTHLAYAQAQWTMPMPDEHPPVLTLLGDNPMTWEAKTTFTAADEPGFTAEDSLEGDLTSSVSVDYSQVDPETKGSYIVTYTVSDSTGNVTTAQRAFNVVDSTSPVINLTGSTYYTAEVGYDWTEPGFSASDNYDGDLTSAVVVTTTLDGAAVSSVDTAVQGSYTVTYTVADAAGNPAPSLTRTVVVQDTQAPVVTLAGENPMTLHADTQFNDPGATAVDGADGDLTASIVVVNGVNMSAVGTYSIVYEATDSAGNKGSATRTVQVVDATAPIITLEQGSTVSWNMAIPWSEPGYSATDNQDGNITANVAISGDVVDVNTLGAYSILYDVKDAANNAAVTAIRTVNIVPQDTINIVSLVDNGDSASATFVVSTGTTTYWNYSVDNGDWITVNGELSGYAATIYVAPGSHSVRVVPSDSMTGVPIGAIVSGTVEIVDQDTTAPVISLIGGDAVTHQTGTAWVDPGATAVDDDGTDLTGSITSYTDDEGWNASDPQPGVWTITYSVDDAAGNEGTASRSVTIQDLSPPIITVTGESVVTISQGGGEYSDAGATAVDAVDGDLTAAIVTGGDPVNSNVAGTYTVTYTVQDSSGNTATASRTVVVSDNTPPTITLTGGTVTISVAESWVEPGYTAHDAQDGDVTDLVSVDDSQVNNSVAGSYTVAYKAVDNAGNETLAYRNVVVVSDNYPVIHILGENPAFVQQYHGYEEAGAFATDAEDGNVQVNIDSEATTFTGDTSVEGSYILGYKATDSDGNTATAVRVIVIGSSGMNNSLDGDNNFGGGGGDNSGGDFVNDGGD